MPSSRSSIGRGGSGDKFGTGAMDASGIPTAIDDQAVAVDCHRRGAVLGVIQTGVAAQRTQREAVKRHVEIGDQRTRRADAGVIGNIHTRIEEAYVCSRRVDRRRLRRR